MILIFQEEHQCIMIMSAPDRLENLVLTSLLNTPEENYEFFFSLRQDPRWSDTLNHAYRCHNCSRYFIERRFSSFSSSDRVNQSVQCRRCVSVRDISIVQRETQASTERVILTLMYYCTDIVEAIIDIICR